MAELPAPPSGPRRPRVFLATPFSPASAGGEDAAVFDRVQDGVAEALRLADVELVHPARMQAAGPVLAQVLQALDDADAVVAILAGLNPNVFFEVGYAAQRAPVLVVADATALPFDVRIYRAVTYGGPDELDTLPRRLAAAVRETLRSAHGPDERSLRDYLTAVEQRARRSTADLPAVLAARVEGDADERYVPARLRVAAPDAAPPVDAWRDVRHLFAPPPAAEDTAAAQRPMLIVGPAGSGKSALLRHVARHSGSRPEAIGLGRPRLPLLLSARAVAGVDRADIEERLRAALDADGGLALPVLPPRFISAWARAWRQGWLILLDALDEVPPDARIGLDDWLPSFAAWCEAQGHRLVLTSRPAAGLETLLRRPVQLLRLAPLDVESREQLARCLLGPQAAPFLAALDRWPLAARACEPRWLVLAAARHAQAGTLPPRLVDLVEAWIADTLALARRSRGRQGLDERVLSAARPLLDRLALASPDEAERAMAEFLHDELGLPQAEARGRAAESLEHLLDDCGLTVRHATGWTFSTPWLLEHCVASRMRATFTTALQRAALLDRWWRGERREVVLSFLGQLEAAGEPTAGLVARVLPRWPPGWLAWRRDPRDELDRAGFLVQAALAGVSLPDRLRRRLERRLRRWSADAEFGPQAAECLARLGDPSALEAWLRSGRDLESGPAYAAAALATSGHVDRLIVAARDPALAAPLRAMAVLLLPATRRTSLARELVGETGADETLRGVMLHLIVRADDREVALDTLRSGAIDVSLVPAWVVAVAHEARLELMFDAADDPLVPARLRDALQAAWPQAALLQMRALSSDPRATRAQRLAAGWLSGTLPERPDLAPLWADGALTPASVVASMALAEVKAPGCLVALAARQELPRRLRRVALQLSAKAERWDELEALVRREDVDDGVRAAALREVYQVSPPRGYRLAASLTPASARAAEAGAVLDAGAAELVALVRDPAGSGEQRVAALSLLAQAHRTAELLSLVRATAPGSEAPAPADVDKLALAMAAEVGCWSALVAMAGADDLDQHLRAVALHLLGRHARRAELRELLASARLDPTLRALAAQQLSD